MDNESEPKEACRAFSRISPVPLIVELSGTLDNFPPGPGRFYLSALRDPSYKTSLHLTNLG